MFEYLKHMLNVIALYSWLGWNLYSLLSPEKSQDDNNGALEANQTATTERVPAFSTSARVTEVDRDMCWLLFTYIVTFIQYLIILPVPQVLCNLLGLTIFNTFPGDIEMKIPSNEHIKPLTSNDNLLKSARVDHQLNDHERETEFQNIAPPISKVPHLCFRVVTRGSYPELVQGNVHKNFLTCIESGLMNFSIEVVTDQDIYITNRPQDGRIRQLIVPKYYKTSTGAMFKARALQYALEPGISPVSSGDYIVHLDEETIITRNAVNGISNFALDGKYAFGQGLITYANLDVINILTTLADSYRVAEDMGKIRFQLAALHSPIFGWKGSFVVSKYEAESDVTYDHGPDGSIAEDCYFSMVAITKGYKFDFIQGEMREKSPFTIIDFLKQRRRWVQGIWLVVHNCNIPIRTKFFLIMSHYAWLTLPITTLNIAIGMVVQLPITSIPQLMAKFCLATTTYMYIFGFLKTYDLKPRSISIILLYLLIQTITMTFNAVVENVAVIWGLFSPKHHFYVVKKDFGGKVILDS